MDVLAQGTGPEECGEDGVGAFGASGHGLVGVDFDFHISF